MPNGLLSPGPAGLLPPAATAMGLDLPVEGTGAVEGRILPEAQVLEEAARKLAHAKVPTFFPGPMVLWQFTEESRRVADAVLEVAESNGIGIIPMPDYRPKYPKIEPESEINPNHPNLTIWHNKIDVCLFVGVHCHYSNIALKIIRGGTSCYTIALCSYAGDEEANLTVRDLSAPKILEMGRLIRKMKTNSRGF
ncbi:MAG: carbon monoxide dehydrogenase [Nitrospiraceae bacterium]|nr:carbon monoxide dehydrogenase [Nitrospiraceae bacterium]